MRRLVLAAVALASWSFGSSAVSASSYAVDWLDMSSLPVAGVVNDGTIYPLPGYGNVRVSYTSGLFPVGPNPNWTRVAQGAGSVNHLGDNYAWTGADFAVAVNGFSGSPVKAYTFTFEFLSGPTVAGEILLGVFGLGRNDSEAGSSITTVIGAYNTTFLGDHDLGANFGPTQYSNPVAGVFQLQNSVPQPGAGFFNTDFGVVRMDESLTTLTFRVNHIDEDGIGFTVGRAIVPEPAALGVLVPVGALLLRRR
jgi:hypothetical protein